MPDRKPPPSAHSRNLVGRLAVHVDQPAALPNCDQVVPGLARAWLEPLQVDRRAGYEQFPAPAGVFHVANLNLAADFDFRDKAVAPLKEDSLADVRIDHVALPSV